MRLESEKGYLCIVLLLDDFEIDVKFKQVILHVSHDICYHLVVDLNLSVRTRYTKWNKVGGGGDLSYTLSLAVEGIYSILADSRGT